METRTLVEGKDVMTVAQMAEYLGVSRTFAYALLREIPSARIGRLRRVRRQDVDAFVESRVAVTR